MDIEWHKEAEKELLKLQDSAQKEIKQYVQKLPEEGLTWDKVELIQRKDIGLQIYRLKIMPENPSELNYRAVFDVKDRKYIIYKVGSRPNFYREESLKQAQKRRK